MATLFLILIYITFISLGLPDSILGSGWSVMYPELGVSLSSAGIISMIISSGTIISSLMSGRLIARFTTGVLTLISVIMTAVALCGFSFAPNFIWLCLLAVPLGLGAGAVDSALNNFVAIHYEARHMSWLHCFWGVGATAGPLIMSLMLNGQGGWRNGYLIISMIQIGLVLCLIFSLPLWKKYDRTSKNSESETKYKPVNVFKIKGAKLTFLSFFCYCAIEMTTGLWGSSYLVQSRGLSAGQAAQWISLFYLGITIGRLLSGFISMKFTNCQLVRIGQFMILLGILQLLLPLPNLFAMSGICCIGLGCAPIFPSMLHETPNRFGEELSQSMMGKQMAAAYVGTTCVPPIFGLIINYVGTSIFPLFLLLILIIMVICVIISDKVIYQLESKEIKS